MPKVTIITCSYNKPEFITDTIKSVLSQSFNDFEYIILENSSDKVTRKIVHSFTDKRLKIIDVDVSDRERRRIYIESHLKNTYTPRSTGEYIMYLADDDILEPACFEEHLRKFKKDKKQMANYHGYRVEYVGTDKTADIISATKTFGPHRSPKERMDGGSLMFKKKLLDNISGQLFKRNWHDAHISDSLFLEKLSKLTVFYPIDKILHTKRITKVSVHTFIDNDGSVLHFRPEYGWEHINLEPK